MPGSRVADRSDGGADRESDTAAEVDRAARDSSALDWSVRIGLVAYGAVHLLIAWVAVRLVFHHHSGKATGQGALAQLAGDPVGRATLVAMAVAFVALLVWQGIAATVGYRRDEGWKRHFLRIGAVARAVIYGYFAWACARLAYEGSKSSTGSPQGMTARVMHAPGGTLLVAAVGCAIAAVGVGMAVFGLRKGFLRQLDEKARNSERRLPIVVLGQVGYVVKGVAFAVIGALLVWAAIARSPQKSGGLDQALYEVLGHALGSVAVIVVGVGFASFGLFLFARSRHLSGFALTS